MMASAMKNVSMTCVPRVLTIKNDCAYRRQWLLIIERRLRQVAVLVAALIGTLSQPVLG